MAKIYLPLVLKVGHAKLKGRKINTLSLNLDLHWFLRCCIIKIMFVMKIMMIMNVMKVMFVIIIMKRAVKYKKACTIKGTGFYFCYFSIDLKK